MKLSACILPADAAALLEQVIPMINALERPDLTPEERFERCAKARAWLVETSSFLKLNVQPRETVGGARVVQSVPRSQADYEPPVHPGPSRATRPDYSEGPPLPHAAQRTAAPIHPGPQRTQMPDPRRNPNAYYGKMGLPKKPCGCDDKTPPSTRLKPDGSLDFLGALKRSAQAAFREWLLGEAKKGIER